MAKGSIFLNTDLLFSKEKGEYDDSYILQLYKFNDFYLIYRTYLGSCDGCINGFYLDADDYDYGNIERDSFVIIKYLISRAEYFVSEQDVINRYNELDYYENGNSDNDNDEKFFIHDLKIDSLKGF